LFVSFKITLEEVREKKDPEHHKDDKQLDDDNDPHVPPPLIHRAETFIVESEDISQFTVHNANIYKCENDRQVC
jgi:hypothetical protein